MIEVSKKLINLHSPWEIKLYIDKIMHIRDIWLQAKERKKKEKVWMKYA